MKKHKWFAALAVMVMALAVAGCSDGSSGNEFATGSSEQVTAELITVNVQ